MSDSFAWFFSYCYTDIIKLFMLLQTMTSHVHTISAFNCYSNDIQSVSFPILLIKNKYRWFFFLLEKCIHDNFIIILSTFAISTYYGQHFNILCFSNGVRKNAIISHFIVTKTLAIKCRIYIKSHPRLL